MPVEGVGEDGTGVHEGDSMTSRDPLSARVVCFSWWYSDVQSVVSWYVRQSVWIRWMDIHPFDARWMPTRARCVVRARVDEDEDAWTRGREWGVRSERAVDAVARSERS